MYFRLSLILLMLSSVNNALYIERPGQFIVGRVIVVLRRWITIAPFLAIVSVKAIISFLSSLFSL